MNYAMYYITMQTIFNRRKYWPRERMKGRAKCFSMRLDWGQGIHLSEMKRSVAKLIHRRPAVGPGQDSRISTQRRRMWRPGADSMILFSEKHKARAQPVSAVSVRLTVCLWG